jgi:hypothetical protein
MDVIVLGLKYDHYTNCMRSERHCSLSYLPILLYKLAHNIIYINKHRTCTFKHIKLLTEDVVCKNDRLLLLVVLLLLAVVDVDVAVLRL